MQVIWGFGALFCFYENLAEASEKIFGGYKFALIKVSVGLIVFQGIVEEILFATHAIDVSGNDHYTANEREQRYLALIILVEYVFLSIAALYAFGARIIMDNKDEGAADEPLQLTMGEFVSRIFKFSDTCRDLEPNGAQLTDSLLDGNGLSESSIENPGYSDR